MPGKPRSKIPGFLRPQEIAKIAEHRGIPFSLAGFKRRIHGKRVQPDKYEGRAYKPSPLFHESRLEALLKNPPTKHSKLGEGEATTYTTLAKAREINSRIHLRQVQQFLKDSKTDPTLADAWKNARMEKHGKAKREIFPASIQERFLDMVQKRQLAGLFAGEPRKKPRIRREGAWQPELREGETTTTAVFRSAQKMDSNIQPIHLRAFLGRARQGTDARLRTLTQKIRVVSHLKSSATVVPQELGAVFLNLVRTNKLSQFFGQPLATIRRARRTPQKTVEARTHRKAPPAPEPLPTVPDWFQKFGKTEAQFGVAVHNLRLMLPQHGREIVEGHLAGYLRLSPRQMAKLIQSGKLVTTQKGTINTESVKALFKGYL